MSADYRFNREANVIFLKSVRDAVEETAIELQRVAKLILSKPGRGVNPTITRGPRKGKPKYRYTPSAPLDPPAVQTGHLRRSVQVDTQDIESLTKPSAMTGTNVVYGRHLEYGTKNMAPRPWMRRAVVRTGYQIPGIVKKHMNWAFIKLKWK